MFELKTYVEAGSSSGFFANVIRTQDKECRECYYTMENIHFKIKFLQDIRLTTGVGGYSCSFNDREMVEFHQELERRFSHESENAHKRGVSCVGRQPEMNVWVLNPNVHINEDGHLIENSELVWTPIGGPCLELMGSRKGETQRYDIHSDITLPLTTAPIEECGILLKNILKHNYVPGIVTLATALYCCHSQDILERFDACCLPMLIGNCGTGKTLSSTCALAMCGQIERGSLMKTKATTDPFILERCAASSLPFTLDDAKKVEDIGDLLIGLCNGRLTGNLKSGAKKPKSCPILACNFSPAHVARYAIMLILFQIPYESTACMKGLYACTYMQCHVYMHTMSVMYTKR
jgi:hypothetical protein